MAPYPGQRALARLPLDHQTELVSRLQIRVEVDLTGKHFGQPKRQVDALSRAADGGRERRGVAIDLALDGHHRHLLDDRGHARHKSRRALAAGARGDQTAIAVDLVFEATHAAVGEPINAVRPAGTKLPHVEGLTDS